nr:glutamic acid-rich protein-like [Tanacetum cinerariifolium]
MASAIICLSTSQKFNFSKYIFESLVRNVDNGSKFYMYPRFIQLIIQNQLEEQVQDDVDDAAAQGADTAVEGDDVHEISKPSPTPPTPPPPQS